MSASLKSTVLAIAASRDARKASSEARRQYVEDILSETARIRKENQDLQLELAADLRRNADDLHRMLSQERTVLANRVNETRREFQNERRTLIQSIEASKNDLRNKLKSDTDARLDNQESLMNHIHTFMDANRNDIDAIRQTIQSRLEAFKSERREGIELWNSMLGSRIQRSKKETDKNQKGANQFAIQIPFAPSQKKHAGNR